MDCPTVFRGVVHVGAVRVDQILDQYCGIGMGFLFWLSEYDSSDNWVTEQNLGCEYLFLVFEIGFV